MAKEGEEKTGDFAHKHKLFMASHSKQPTVNAERTRLLVIHHESYAEEMKS